MTRPGLMFSASHRDRIFMLWPAIALAAGFWAAVVVFIAQLAGFKP